MMRIASLFAFVVSPVIAQVPAVHLTNTARPAAAHFQIGDRFEVSIAGGANQPVSARITTNGRTHWGPVIGWTDSGGHWIGNGQFERSDFGAWKEVWTVGGKLASPGAEFSVDAPCLKDGQGFAMTSGLNIALTCDTAVGRETFVTVFETAPPLTAEQYQAEILQEMVLGGASELRLPRLGDAAGESVGKLIGVNALNESETRNVLTIIRRAYEEPDRIPRESKDPVETLRLLQRLATSSDGGSLKQEIAQTAAYVQTRQ